VVSKVSTSPPAGIETETKDAIEVEILENVPKTMKTKAELLVRKMKADPNIAWSEKGELKYKGETVRGSNVVDLVNDVLRKGKYFNPQGWETFGEALREANLSWCFWGVRSNRGGTLLSFARSRCSFRLSDIFPAVLVTNPILKHLLLVRLLRMFPILVD
jgi:hypothetical protein